MVLEMAVMYLVYVVLGYLSEFLFSLQEEILQACYYIHLTS